MSEDEKVIERLEDTFYADLGKGINKFQKITLYEGGIQDVRKLLDLYQQKCKQNEDAKDYIEYYLLNNMSIEGNAENTHKELKKLYNMLGGDNLR